VPCHRTLAELVVVVGLSEAFAVRQDRLMAVVQQHLVGVGCSCLEQVSSFHPAEPSV
jgi:hypothetical protein